MNTSAELFARWEAEMDDVPQPLLTPLHKPIARTDDGLNALLVATVGGSLLLIVLVIAAVAAGKAL